MVLTRVALRHFRNLGVQEVEVPPQGAALVGANAQGKSNFLEAVYYLETFRSFRGARDGQLLAFGEDVFRVSARLEGEGREESDREREVAAAYQRTGRRKKVTVDGVEPPRLGDAIGTLAAVIFSPSDVAMVSEGPDERRRFLDIVLSLNRPGYLEALQAFRHVLAQRNATLREDSPLALVRAWDEGLIEAGARVMEGRRAWIERWTGTFARIYGLVSGGRDARLDYRPNVTLDGAEGVEALAGAYRAALQDSAETERRMRTTMVGPQRDEMVITLEGERELDVRDYGSGGQRRTAALALRLVEAATIRETRGREPLLLLDDVFAELDPGRSERILELMEREETGQVILTAPRDADVRLRGGSLPRWSIEDGVISA